MVGCAGLQRGTHCVDQRLQVRSLVVGGQNHPHGSGGPFHGRLSIVSGVRNAEIAAALDELADLNELDGAVVYRVVAYRQAARAVRESPASVEQLSAQGRLIELRGIGKTIAEKIQ